MCNCPFEYRDPSEIVRKEGFRRASAVSPSDLWEKDCFAYWGVCEHAASYRTQRRGKHTQTCNLSAALHLHTKNCTPTSLHAHHQ